MGKTPYQSIKDNRRLLLDDARPTVVGRLLQRAPCPLLLVRSEIGARVAELEGFRRVLLPLNGAPSSAAVVGPVFDLAERSGAEVDLLYVAMGASKPEEAGSLAAPRYVDQPQHEWTTWVGEFIGRFATALGQCPLSRRPRLLLCRGEPAEEILSLARARESDLIVLEWRGRLDPPHAETVRGVLRDAPAPILLRATSPRS